MRTTAGLSDVSRHVAPASKMGLFAKISDYARRAMGILGLSAGVGIAAAAPSPHYEAPVDGVVLSAPAPSTPAPGTPSRVAATELRDREWKAVVEKGVGAKDFAMKAFGTDNWGLLVDQEGNRLSDPSKLMRGKKYLVAQNAQDAAMVAAAVKSMGGMELSPKHVRTSSVSAHKHVRTASAEVRHHVPEVRAEVKVTSDSLVSYAEEHLGKPYRMGANGVKAIDCSQLVVESLKRAGIVGQDFDTTAAGFHEMSTAKKLGNVQKGDLLFLHKRSGHVGHVAIALSAPDEKGYIDIIDASSSQGGVTERRFHMSMAGLSAGSLPFVGKTVAPDAAPVYARAVESTKVAVADAAETVADAGVELASAVGNAVISSAHAEEVPHVKTAKVAKSVRVAVTKPAVATAKSVQPVRTASVASVRPVVAVTRTAQAQVRQVEISSEVAVLEFESAKIVTPASKPEPSRFVEVEKPATAEILDFPTVRTADRSTEKTPVSAVSEKVEARVNATVVSLSSRLSDRDQAASIRASLEKKSLSEQIDHFRALSEAANDPVYSLQSGLTATKLEIVKLHGERKLVSENISYYKAQAAKSVPGAFETVVKLGKIAASLDAKIGDMKLSANYAEYQLKKAA